MNKSTRIINPEAYYQRARANRLAGEIRWLMGRRRAPFWGNALRLDDLTSRDDAGDFCENRLLGDGGASVESLVSRIDGGGGSADNGRWRIELERVVASLKGTDRAIWFALLADWRTAPAAKIAHTNRPHVDRLKKTLRQKLDVAHRLWKRRQK